jgi:predicted MPP superfamily phosphohydrolase
MKLLVSKGIGASRLQLRVGVRPEINLLLFD